MSGPPDHSRPCPRAAWPATFLIAALALAVFGCSKSLADTTLAGDLPQAPKVSAVGQTFAWSALDAATGAWRLMVRENGITRVLPVAGRSTPFDVDLGDDGHGHLLASYSRCSAAPSKTSESPHGCRLYYYDLSRGVEHPISVANVRGYSQFDPTMAAGRVAFARIADGRHVGAGNRVRLFVQNLSGGKPRQLPGGFENNRAGTGPTALDLSATALAFSWDAQGATAFEPFSLVSSQVSVDTLSGRQTLIAFGTSGEVSVYRELAPTLEAGTVYYEETGNEEGGALHQLRSLTLRGAHPGVVPSFPPSVTSGFEELGSTATSTAGTIYSHCPIRLVGVKPSCEVALAEHVGFTDPDRELAHVARPTTVSESPMVPSERRPRASGPWLAWSAYDPVGRDYRLMLRGPGGAAAPAPVPPRAVPFDVELGPRAGGGLIAVYSRCRAEPRLDPGDMLPLPATGQGCRLYRYDIGSPGEHAIPGSGSRFLPSVWNGELAFAELTRGGVPAIYLGSLKGRVAHRLAVGPAGNAPGSGPRAVVLHAGRVAFVWEYRTKSGLRSELRFDGPGGHSLVLDSVSSRNGSARELSPSFAGLSLGTLVWARRQGDGVSRIEVYGLPNHHLDSYLAPDPIEALATNYFAPVNHIAIGSAFYVLGAGGEASIRQVLPGLASAFHPEVRELPIEIG